jgi:hypothetical protein
LAPIVVNQTISMIASVKFDCETAIAVKEVWAGQEQTLAILDRNLNARPRKSRKHEKHS